MHKAVLSMFICRGRCCWHSRERGGVVGVPVKGAVLLVLM